MMATSRIDSLRRVRWALTVAAAGLVLVPGLPALAMLWRSLHGATGEFTATVWVSAFTGDGGPGITAWPADVLLDTMAVASVALGVAMLFGVVVGFALARFRIVGGRAAAMLVVLPLLIPAYVSGWGWVQLLAPLGALGTTVGAGWALGTAWFPVIALFAESAFRRVDGQQLEAARVVGGPAFAFRAVAWPAAWPAIAAGAGLVLLFVLRDFGVPALFRVNTLALDVYSGFEAHVDYRRFVVPTVRAAPLLVVGAGVVSLIAWLERGSPRGRLEALTTVSTRTASESTTVRATATTLVWGALAISPGLPLATMIASALRVPDPFGRLLALLQQRHTADSIARTFETALTAGGIAALLVGAATWWLVRRRTRLARLPLALAILPLAVPASLAGIGVIAVSGSLDGPWALPVVHALLFAPFVVRLVAPATAAVPEGLRDAARVCGHGPGSVFRHVDLPLIGHSVLIAGALVFVFSVGEVAATVLIAPPGEVLMAPRIYNLVHYGRQDEVALLGLVFVAMTALPWLVVTAISGRRLRSL